MENLALAVFQVESEAYQAFTELSSAPYNGTSVISEIALVTMENGRLLVKQNGGNAVKAVDDTLCGGLVGSLVGILGGPIGMLLGLGVGSMIGSAVDADDLSKDASLFEKIGAKMSDGDIALILLMQETDEKVLDAQLAKYSPIISRWDAAEVAQQVEEAQRMEQEMQRQARQAVRKQKTDEFKQKVEERRDVLKAEFEVQKEKLKKKLEH